MKKILAKGKGNDMYIVSSVGTQIFQGIETTYSQQIQSIQQAEHILFNPEKILNDDERFYVELDESLRQETIYPYINALNNTVGLNQIERENLPNISVIAMVEIGDNENLILTRVFPRYFIKKKIISFEGEPKLGEERKHIIFSGDVDVYYIGNKLFFRNYAIARTIFPKLNDFYRNATQEEVNSFFGQIFFTQSERNWKISERNLKRIAIVMTNNEIQWNEVNTRRKYVNYANDVNAGITINEDKFIIESDKELSKVLNILDERIYKTPVTNKIREANSVTNIEN